MELRNLQTFIRAAELHSFSEAARQTGYSQSAVSTQIAQLEHELKVRLFDRIGRSVSLTPQGSDFLEYAQRIIRLAEAARNHLQEAPVVSGDLRIVMAESLLVSAFPQVLRRFREQFPKVNVIVDTGVTEDMITMLHRGETDLIYTLDRRIHQSDLICECEQPEPIVFIAPPKHPLCNHSVLHLRDLVNYPFLLTEKRMSYREQLDQQLAAKGLEIIPAVELGNTDVLQDMVHDGYGVSFLPEFAARRSIDRNYVKVLDVLDCEVSIWRQLIRHRAKWVTPAMRAMMQVLSDELSPVSRPL